ncbi:hypothetical protein N0V82_008484 [Gnomoniopsis sp. IMI 355080]|nr:hypothetical protein N0V82_008484 [Gnomoniopsis sp. IMI 355080]
MDVKQEGILEQVDIVNGNGRATQQHYEPTTDEEKSLERRVNLKLDLSVVLVLALGFILCGIDKTNIGFVATTSFLKDANLEKNDIGNSLSLLIAWGAICMAHAGIHNRATLIALRLLLGVAEAGFTQNALYYFSTMFPKYSVGWRMGLFTGMYSVAGAFAGLITYGLLQIDTPQVKGWQYVFLIEGGLTILIGVIALFVLPRRLDTAWFLTPTERLHAMRRMMLDLAGTQETADISGGNITRRDIWDVAKDWKKLLTVFCNMLAVLPVTAFTTFLPLIVSGMGYEGNQATLMSVPPFVA